ncbi:MAG: cytochrome c oxidase accessory protein CcoG [Bacteroidia bacterium]
MNTSDPHSKKKFIDESFRDSVATINQEGKRNWIYPLKPSGKYYNARTWLSIFYIIVFFTLPFIKFNGEPIFLFNIIERKFILFGFIFWPQDFFIFGIGMVTMVIFIALFTVAFGRIFCGWICPQTIFMEMIFRKIEYFIEGDAPQQKALSKQPWNKEKILKRGGKYVVFFLLSFLIANTFLSYIIGVDELFKIISEPISQHLTGFISLLLFTGVFFFVYAWFREQACIVVCPYGRLQGVLMDRDTMVVAYDYVRGEPRAKYKKNETRKYGDCIDCGQCVKVCPTGIDIRNGTQLECVNCTACIDACDFMMEKVGFEKGLIRYASENNIAANAKQRFTPRMKAYSAVLTLLVGVLVFLLVTRTDVDATILRAQGQLYQEYENNKISNLYNVKVINKTRKEMPISLKLENADGEIELVGHNSLVVPPEGLVEGTFFVKVDKSFVKERKNKLVIGVYSGDKKIETIKTNFLGPFIN